MFNLHLFFFFFPPLVRRRKMDSFVAREAVCFSTNSRDQASIVFRPSYESNRKQRNRNDPPPLLRSVCVCVCAPPITRDGRVVSIVPWSPAHPFHPFPGLVQYRLLEPPARQGPRTAPGSRRSSINRRGAWTRFVFLSPFAR